MAKENRAVAMLPRQVAAARQWLEGTMADVTAAQAHWVPPRNALAHCDEISCLKGLQGGRGYSLGSPPFTDASDPSPAGTPRPAGRR